MAQQQRTQDISLDSNRSETKQSIFHGNHFAVEYKFHTSRINQTKIDCSPENNHKRPVCRSPQKLLHTQEYDQQQQKGPQKKAIHKYINQLARVQQGALTKSTKPKTMQTYNQYYSNVDSRQDPNNFQRDNQSQSLKQQYPSKQQIEIEKIRIPHESFSTRGSRFVDQKPFTYCSKCDMLLSSKEYQNHIYECDQQNIIKFDYKNQLACRLNNIHKSIMNKPEDSLRLLANDLKIALTNWEQLDVIIERLSSVYKQLLGDSLFQLWYRISYILTEIKKLEKITKYPPFGPRIAKPILN